MSSEPHERSSEWIRRHIDEVDPTSHWAVSITALLLGAMAGVVVWVMMRHLGQLLG